jgi:hypothetical protein
MTVRSPQDIPTLCDQLRRENFYGEVRLIFTRGQLTRMVTEQSHQIQIQEKTPNVTSNR